MSRTGDVATSAPRPRPPRCASTLRCLQCADHPTYAQALHALRDKRQANIRDRDFP